VKTDTLQGLAVVLAGALFVLTLGWLLSGRWYIGCGMAAYLLARCIYKLDLKAIKNEFDCFRFGHEYCAIYATNYYEHVGYVCSRCDSGQGSGTRTLKPSRYHHCEAVDNFWDNDGQPNSTPRQPELLGG